MGWEIWAGLSVRGVFSLVDDAPDGQGFSDISVPGWGVGHPNFGIIVY